MNVQNPLTADHVRYVVSLLREAGGERYTAMKTSIEVDDSQNEDRVRDIITRALKCELPHDTRTSILYVDAPLLVWEWLETIRQESGSPILWHMNTVICGEGTLLGDRDKANHLYVRIFTKSDEAASNALFHNRKQ